MLPLSCPCSGSASGLKCSTALTNILKLASPRSKSEGGIALCSSGSCQGGPTPLLSGFCWNSWVTVTMRTVSPLTYGCYPVKSSAVSFCGSRFALTHRRWRLYL